MYTVSSGNLSQLPSNIISYGLKLQLVFFRVNDLIESGLSRYVIDPDGEFIEKISKSIEKQSKKIPLPLLYLWTSNLSSLPEQFSYLSIYEYLLVRKIKIIRASKSGYESDNDNTIMLPTAEKPLRKGYNFFASGHVDDVKLNPQTKVTHISATVLSSMKENKYKAKVVLDTSNGLVLNAQCACIAGKGGKCNHIAALLYYCLDFQYYMKTQSPSKTEKLQQWHRPSRKAKKNTKPTKTGMG